MKLILVLLYHFSNWYQENSYITEELSFLKAPAEMTCLILQPFEFPMYFNAPQAGLHHKQKNFKALCNFALEYPCPLGEGGFEVFCINSYRVSRFYLPFYKDFIH